MLQGNWGDPSRLSAVERLSVALASGRSAVVSGPRGIGKSQTLRRAARALQRRGLTHVYLRRGEPSAADRLAAAPLAQPHLIDGFEQADDRLLEVLLERLRRGGHGAVAVRTSSRQSSADAALLAVLSAPADPDRAGFEVIQLRLCGPGEMAGLARRRTDGPLTSAQARVIAALAWGRPAWVDHLLALDARGRLAESPWPAIRPLHAVDAALPEVSRSVAIADRGLSPESVAAAIALADLGPRSMSAVESLIGASALSELVEHDLLVPAPADPEHHGVPELTAAGLLLRADAAALSRARDRAARTLVHLEMFGVPLSDREADYCARYLQAGPDEADLAAARDRCIRRTAEGHVAFDDRDALRVLYLRSGSGQTLDPIERARVIAVTRGTIDAQRHLAHELAENDALTRGERFAAHALYACFAAETRPSGSDALVAHRTPSTRAAGPDDAEPGDDHEALDVLALWNEPELADPDRALLHRARASAEMPAIALIAEQLLDLDRVRFGLRTVRSSPAERYGELAQLAMASGPEYRDLLAGAAIAEGLILFLTGETALRADGLRSVAERLAAPAFHRLWVEHLIASAEALTAGAVPLARAEWEGFERHRPRFLPGRLIFTIGRIGTALRDPGSVPQADRLVTHHMLAYFSGSFDDLGATTLDPAQGESDGSPANELEVMALARAHLRASEAQHPTALLAAAAELEERRLWAPAVYALTEARSIYRRRRAAGSAAQCDARIAALEASAREQIPWFEVSSIAAAPRVSLTARERETAVFAAGGLTNKQIAERLHCSVRTVESHLASARAKLGAANRRELAQRLDLLRS